MNLMYIYNAKMWIDIFGSIQEQMAGFCECTNVPSGSIKFGEHFHLAPELVASQKGLRFMELINLKVTNFTRTPIISVFWPIKWSYAKRFTLSH